MLAAMLNKPWKLTTFETQSTRNIGLLQLWTKSVDLLLELHSVTLGTGNGIHVNPCVWLLGSHTRLMHTETAGPYHPLTYTDKSRLQILVVRLNAASILWDVEVFNAHQIHDHCFGMLPFPVILARVCRDTGYPTKNESLATATRRAPQIIVIIAIEKLVAQLSIILLFRNFFVCSDGPKITKVFVGLYMVSSLLMPLESRLLSLRISLKALVLVRHRIQAHANAKSVKPAQLQDREAHQISGYLTSEEKNIEHNQVISEAMYKMRISRKWSVNRSASTHFKRSESSSMEKKSSQEIIRATLPSTKVVTAKPKYAKLAAGTFRLIPENSTS